MPSIDNIKRIYEVLGEQTVLLPLQAGTKKCLQRAWQKTKLEDTKVEAYVAKLVVGNIGVSLGLPSGGLCSIDFDEDDVAAEFLDANPGLTDSLRTRGARGCNVWIRIDGDFPNACKIFSRSRNKPVGEWRATGNYTAIYGKHPSGCDYSWLIDAPVKIIKWSEIVWPADVSVNEPTKTVEKKIGKPLAESLLEARRKTAENILEDVEWIDDREGRCLCPGRAKHTNPDGLRDCEVFVDGVPSVHCFHTSCESEVARMNAQLRQATMNNEVVIIPDGYATVQDSAEVLFEVLKSTKKFYSRGGSVCEIAYGGKGGPVLDPVSKVRAMATWEKFIRFAYRSFKDGEEKITLTMLPEQMAGVFLASDERMILPLVEGVVTCPILYKDATGQLQVHNDGYNPHTKLFVANPRPDEPVPNVKLDEAVEAIRDLVSDFDFESPNHRSRAIMSFITPAMVFAGLLGGRPPVDVAEADQSQAGKGYRQQMLTNLYGETPSIVTQRKGGVGSLDESFQESLIRGRPFIFLGNLRGKLDSPYIEEFLTTQDVMGARGFGKGEVEVAVNRFVVCITSNELELTQDLANRSSIVKVRKRGDKYPWKQYGPNAQFVKEWVRQNQPYYLGCVFRVVQEWFAQGCQTLPHAGHDFHWWAGRAEWIVQTLFREAACLEGHRAIQQRAGDGRLGWLQRVALQAEKSGRLGQALKMHDIISLCGEGGFEVYRKQGDHSRNFPTDGDELRYLGLIFGPLFQRSENRVSLDGYVCTRAEVQSCRESSGQTFIVKAYTFQKTGDFLSEKTQEFTKSESSPEREHDPKSEQISPGVVRVAQEPSVSFMATV